VAAEALKVTRQRHLHRTVVFATTCALFAATATGSALAWNGTVNTVAPSVVRSAPVVNEVHVLPSKAPSARIGATSVASRVTTARATASSTPKAKSTSTRATSTVRAKATSRATRAPRSRVATAPTHRTVTISRYVDSPGSQAAIDKCKLVLWTHAPLWLAGHNWCGYQWMAYVATGTVVHVTSGAAAGTYVVTGHKKLGRQSGSLPHLSADLVLQTCVGSGTGLTLLRRV
jgi:hypothetical protein